jgi:hypothetical protein
MTLATRTESGSADGKGERRECVKCTIPSPGGVAFSEVMLSSGDGAKVLKSIERAVRISITSAEVSTKSTSRVE